MSKITIAGAGAFGTSLAITLARAGNAVTLWARDRDAAHTMQIKRCNDRYLPGDPFPPSLHATANEDALKQAKTLLLAMPTQKLRGFLDAHSANISATCVACCKGIEKGSGLLPTDVIVDVLGKTPVAVLTGPGFAGEIARGLPTALTLAASEDTGATLQTSLSTDTLRLYLSTDVTGAQLGGALKNVIAIACGITTGAGLGESARAALMTRGYAEMTRLAVSLGARAETLAGLSGFGDLVLTCSSVQSRNYSLGHALGKGGKITQGTTLEGVATAAASFSLAKKTGVEMPITEVVAAVLAQKITIKDATKALLSRPLRPEI